MFIDDKIFEFIVLEPDKIERLKQATKEVCSRLGNVKIRSSLFSKIVIDANGCNDEQELKNFLEYYPPLNDICKIHLQYPHDLLFPAKIECASEKIETIKFDCGFLYNYNFMHTTKVVEGSPTNHGMLNIMVGLQQRRKPEVSYPHTNWYYDQECLRLKFSKLVDGNNANFSLEFDYSSFIKIFIHQYEDKARARAGAGDDSIGALLGLCSQYHTHHLTITVANGYPPSVYRNLENQKQLSRVYDLPNESFWNRLIKSSAFQMNLLFPSAADRRDFISHLHFAVTCPIIFLSQPLQVQTPALSLITPPNVSILPWEIRYGIQMIMDCGDIGCYHFHRQNYIQVISKYVAQKKYKEAEAYLVAVNANLKLQPMMEVIEAPRPVITNFGEDYVMMRTIIITPTRKLCFPPMQLMSSRAFRILGGAEKFIQIKFRDEDMQIMRQDAAMMQHVVLKPGLEGIQIAGKMFFDLARSNSMFREHGSYFYQTDNKNEIVSILKSLGNFKPEPSSKTAARVGQYFTSAREVKRKLKPHEYAVIPDYYSSTTNSDGDRYCFSDGVGLMSLKFANFIKEEFQISYLPSAFQVRCLGFKGVLSINDKHPYLIDAGGNKLVLFRESQKKFDVSKSMEIVLGIVKYSAPASVRFNKPLINLWDQAAKKQRLSERFDKRVNELFSANLYQITSTLTDSEKFNTALQKLPTYINFQQCLRKTWIDEPFFRSMVTAAALQQLKSLQYYKQISLPIDLGRSLLGIVDVTGILKEGQVFVQYSKHMSFYGKDSNEKIICTGNVAVSRSPVYNIGDLRILKAVDVPELRHLFDVIVFPMNGSRPHPDEMGGGDLDGDEYSVVWDPLLLLNHSEIAADYTPSVPNPAKDRIEDLPTNSAQFRYDYMTKDYLAKISNCHLAHSDLHSLEHPKVLEMAKNADVAVNFFKSGIPARDIPPDDMCDWYPDFMDKNHLPSYTFPRLLGRLHRKCDRFWNVSNNIINENRYSKAPLNPAYIVNGWEDYKEDATKLYKTYNSGLTNWWMDGSVFFKHLKSTYGIKTEGELFSNQLGAILGRLRNFDADNSTANTTKNLIQNHVFEIFRRYRKHFLESIGEKVDGIGNSHTVECITPKAQKLASAYYKVAYEDGGSLSFPFIAWDVLDKVWTDSTVPVCSNPIYDFIDTQFGKNDSRVGLNYEANITKFMERISSWLKKFNYQIGTSADLKNVMAYVFKLDTRPKNEIVEEFSQLSFGQKLVEFFASVGSFEFLELYPEMKLIHEAAQDTYCRIVFAPFTLNKPNAFEQRKVRGKAFIVAVPKPLKDTFVNQTERLKSQSGCSQISFRIRKENRHHTHFYVWSKGTLQQNERLKEILTITPEIQPSLNFEEVRNYKHQLQQNKIFQ